MEVTQLIRISFRAGIVSPGYLNSILEIAEEAKITSLRFSRRQQLLLEVPKQKYAFFAQACRERNISFSERKTAFDNIVSSYAAAGIFLSDTWLGEGVYKEVFDLFDFPIRLKVNIVDGQQTFVPLFTGHINWIASPHAHFWYLYLRKPGEDSLFCWPELIYTNHMASVTREVERWMVAGEEPSRIVEKLKSAVPYVRQSIERELPLPAFHLPYYEGFNQQGNQYWLGLYRRDEYFSVAFLKDLCRICLQTRINELYITTWKTLIIKGIEKVHRPLWDAVLGRHRINVRHAANELNWLIEDDCEDGLILKRHVIRYFDKADVRTYGLCFSVQLRSRSGVFGSIIIRKEETINPGRLKSRERYSIFYTRDFNPNSSEAILFRDHVEKEHLGPYLVALCKEYYERSAPTSMLREVMTEDVAVKKKEVMYVHQCGSCQTVYLREIGDPERQIAAGTLFEDLPEDYACPLCEAPKLQFQAVDAETLHS